MSNIYIQEPPTNGKVLLVTSVGDIDVELWSKEAPKACRNFIQLCMEGYYNNTLFHRVVKEFIAQGGDPTGTGHGGESIYGKTFKDEFHSRLRFNRRGLVGMANAGPHDNGSQFFFTLGEGPEMDKKHTLFGKVTGHTVYNMMRLQECETDQNERPLHPHKIIKAKILANPFDDIVPRKIHKEEKPEDKKKKSQSKATKNFSLLSFGEEAEEEEEEAAVAAQSFKSKSKSSHDLLDDSHLSSVPAVDQGVKRPHDADDEEEDERLDEDVADSPQHADDEDKEATRENIRKKLKKDRDPHVEEAKKPAAEEEDDDDEDQDKNTKMEELRREAKRLKKELLATSIKKKDEGGTKEAVDEDAEDTTDNSVVAAFKAERRKYKEMRKTQPKKGSTREQQTLAMLAKFQSKLNTARQFSEYGEDEEEEEEEKETEEAKQKEEAKKKKVPTATLR